MFASGKAARRRHGSLQWTRFMQVAPQLHPFTLRLGVVFALIGYGTKAVWPQCTHGSPTRIVKRRRQPWC